jgi:hypothetical protein
MDTNTRCISERLQEESSGDRGEIRWKEATFPVKDGYIHAGDLPILEVENTSPEFQIAD